MARKPGVARDGNREGRAVEVMTVDQVAGYLQLNRLTVYRYVREGKIPAAKIGKVYRILRADVDRFLESRKVTSRPMPAPTRAEVGDEAPRAEPIRVRDVKSPNEIAVRSTRPEQLERRRRAETLILNGDPFEVIIRGLH